MVTDLIINDQNFSQVASDAGGMWGGKCGTRQRQTAYGASPVAAQVPLDVIPMEEWPDRIADQERNKSSLEHIWRDSKIGVWNQGELLFCWVYSGVISLMLEREVMGLPYVELSPCSVGAPITGYRNVGGYIENALREMMSGGVAPSTHVPVSTLRAQDFKPGWQAEAAKYKVRQAADIPRDYQIQGSQLLLNRPMPVGHNWWAHSITHLRMIDLYPQKRATDWSRYGRRGLNQWGGTGIVQLEGSRQLADQAYVITQASV